MKTHLGTFLSIGSPVIAELATECGFDWVLIDLEHGCEAEAAVPNQLRALRGGKTAAIVRVSVSQPDSISRILDWGAHGIMVPHIDSAVEAEQIVQAARYAPRGQRGFSRTVRTYGYGLRPPGQDTPAPFIMAQIESIEGVKHAEEIARVEGIDVLFVGPADLQFDLNNNPESDLGDYAKCLETVGMAAKAAGKTTGILVRELADLQRYRELGFTHIAVDSDVAILRKAYQQTLANLTG
jgi:2-dehydro-3-deoxyglucarate aldolase/4-hydroxy-2-oxoheptanedioate aldolase